MTFEELEKEIIIVRALAQDKNLEAIPKGEMLLNDIFITYCKPIKEFLLCNQDGINKYNTYTQEEKMEFWASYKPLSKIYGDGSIDLPPSKEPPFESINKAGNIIWAIAFMFAGVVIYKYINKK